MSEDQSDNPLEQHSAATIPSRREAKPLPGAAAAAPQRSTKARRAVVDRMVPLAERGEMLRQIARTRWLTNEELVDILTHHQEFGFPIAKEAPTDPRSGSLYLFDRSQTKKFKDDGVNWMKKKGQNRVREDFVKLHIRGVPAITGFYAHCQDNAFFHRRAYRLSDGGEYFLVHYLDESTLDEPNGIHFVSRSHSKRSISDPSSTQDSWAAADKWIDSSSNCGATTVDNTSPDSTPTSVQPMADPLASFSSSEPMLDWQPSVQDHWTAPSRPFSHGFIDGCVENTLEYDQLLDEGLDCFRDDGADLHLDPYMRNGGHFQSSNVPLGPYSTMPFSMQDEPQPSNHLLPHMLITDFSPSGDKCVGGTKVLICLSAELPMEYRNSAMLQIAFGDLCVPVQVVSPTVLRCQSPPHSVGAVRLSVRTLHGHSLTPPTEERFEFFMDQPQQASAMREMPSRLRPPILRNISDPTSHDTAISVSVPSQFYGDHLGKRSMHLGKRRSDSLDVTLTDNHSHVAHDTDREYKIRIVEKLQDTMKRTPRQNSADRPRPIVSIDTSVPMHTARQVESHTPSAGGAFVDDQKLAGLSDEELALTLEKLLVRTVAQLVQLADDDYLLDELHALDKSGYSLLHYCCLYNMGPLLPILLSKGVDVNHKAGCGSTALHLAAATGSLLIVQSLLENGADPEALDTSGYKPADRAWFAGHNEVCAAILKAGGHLTHNMIPSLDLHGNDTPMNISRQPNQPEIVPLQRRRTASDAMIPGLYSAATTPMSLSDDRSTDDTTSSLLQSAFNSLSLHDKCALSLSLSNKPIGFLQNGRFRSTSVETKDDDVEIASVITDNDKESLDMAMAMMSPAELVELEAEARVIQHNVRAWLLRRNYKNLRDAAKIVQHAWRERKRHGSPDKRMGNGFVKLEPMSSDGQQQDPPGLLGRKKFDFLRQQAMESLIIQKNLCRPSLSDMSPTSGSDPL